MGEGRDETLCLYRQGLCCVICRLALLQSRPSVLYWSVALFGKDAPIQDKTEFLESSTKPFVLLLRPASQIASTLSHLLSLLFGKSLLTSNFSYLNIHPYTFLQSLKNISPFLPSMLNFPDNLYATKTLWRTFAEVFLAFRKTRCLESESPMY